MSFFKEWNRGREGTGFSEKCKKKEIEGEDPGIMGKSIRRSKKMGEMKEQC